MGGAFPSAIRGAESRNRERGVGQPAQLSTPSAFLRGVARRKGEGDQPSEGEQGIDMPAAGVARSQMVCEPAANPAGSECGSAVGIDAAPQGKEAQPPDRARLVSEQCQNEQIGSGIARERLPVAKLAVRG